MDVYSMLSPSKLSSKNAMITYLGISYIFTATWEITAHDFFMCVISVYIFMLTI